MRGGFPGRRVACVTQTGGWVGTGARPRRTAPDGRPAPTAAPAGADRRTAAFPLVGAVYGRGHTRG